MTNIRHFNTKILLAVAMLLIVSGLFPKANSVKAAKPLPIPVEIPIEYEWKRMKDGYGTVGDYGSFKFNLGNRKGTIVLKAYMMENYEEPYATAYYDAIKIYRNGTIYLREKNFGIYRENNKIIAGTNRYAVLYYTENNNKPIPRENNKTISGFENAGYTLSGKRFVGAGIYLPKQMNNGVYYLDLPDGWNKDYWRVKAYLYEDLDVEEKLFNEFENYFPLLGKVMWDDMELIPGQIGKLTVVKETPLYKLEGENKVYFRTLKAGETYRIYAFKTGMLNVGGGYYVDRDSKVKYETPGKSKLELMKMRIE